MEKPTKMYLRSLYLNAVRDSIEFYDANILHQFEWNNMSRKMLSFLLEIGVLDEEKLLEAIHEGIIRTAKDMYDSHVEFGSRVDHTGAQAFAYALYHKAFTEEQIAVIDFDHGRNAESFVKRYLVKDMPTLLLTELTTERTGEGLNLVHHQS